MHSHWVLVVEDDPRIASLICRVASDAGFNACSATGPEAIEKAYEKMKPDVIVLDALMPDMDGLEVLQFLNQQFSRARIVIISGSDAHSRAMMENIGKTLGLTIEANISKPFQLLEIRALFEAIRKSLDEKPKPLADVHGNRH